MDSTCKNSESQIEENKCVNELSSNEPKTTNNIVKVDLPQKPLNMKPGAVKLRSWLNKTLRVQMTDGRTLIGVFFCTDRDANIILGSCLEYLPPCVDCDGSANEEPRMLGLVMIPGRHIIKVEIELNQSFSALNMMSDHDDIV